MQKIAEKNWPLCLSQQMNDAFKLNLTLMLLNNRVCECCLEQTPSLDAKNSKRLFTVSEISERHANNYASTSAVQVLD